VIHPNSSLKGASEIEWHFDKDDKTPLTATEKSPGSGPAASTSSQTLCYILHKELQGTPQEVKYQTPLDLLTNILLFHPLYYLI